MQIIFKIVHQLVSLVHFAGKALICKQLAVDFTNDFCCDRHSNGFDLADFFLGKFKTEERLVFVDQVANVLTLKLKYCPMKECEPLKARLYAW